MVTTKQFLLRFLTSTYWPKFKYNHFHSNLLELKGFFKKLFLFCFYIWERVNSNDIKCKKFFFLKLIVNFFKLFFFFFPSLFFYSWDFSVLYFFLSFFLILKSDQCSHVCSCGSYTAPFHLDLLQWPKLCNIWAMSKLSQPGLYWPSRNSQKKKKKKWIQPISCLQIHLHSKMIKKKMK